MKIFNEEEVNIAKKQYSDKFSKCDMLLLPAKSIMCNSETDFTAGVEYAESKVEDLCVEFAEWLSETPEPMSDVYEINEANKTYKELFQQFLKERK